MPWQAKLSEDSRYLELRYSGLVTPQELKDAVVGAMGLMNKVQKTFVLADCSDMVGGHSVLDLYYLIKLYAELGVPQFLKEAIILPRLKSTAEEVQFYETSSRNNGYDVRVFKTRDEALAWLLG